jgi:predicted kinase
MECVVFIGLQGAGKSTFYELYYAATHELVSKDRFKNARDKTMRQRRMLFDAFDRGRSVVVDNTSPAVEDRAEIIVIARGFGAIVTALYFDASPEECLRRNAAREGKARVPEVAIFAAKKRLVPPSMVEGFDRIFRVRTLDEMRFEVGGKLHEPPPERT